MNRYLLMFLMFEPRHEKTGFSPIQSVTAQLISAFVFDIRIVQFIFYLNTKFQAYGHLHIFNDCTGRIVSDLVGNSNCWFSHAVANFICRIISFRIVLSNKLSRDARKPVFGVSDQVRHKPVYAVSENG